MNRTAKLGQVGQSVWLDNITRGLLDSGKLDQYIREFSVTGLTSNPSIYDKAIGGSADYDEQIRRLSAGGAKTEEIFFDLALDDLRARPTSSGPLTTARRRRRLRVARGLAATGRRCGDDCGRRGPASRPGRPANFFIKIPGTTAGLKAIEQTIFAGVPVNVTLLFSTEQYMSAAEAYTRAVERRVEAGLNAYVPSVASVFVSRWDGPLPVTSPRTCASSSASPPGR